MSLSVSAFSQLRPLRLQQLSSIVSLPQLLAEVRQMLAVFDSLLTPSSYRLMLLCLYARSGLHTAGAGGGPPHHSPQHQQPQPEQAGGAEALSRETARELCGVMWETVSHARRRGCVLSTSAYNLALSALCRLDDGRAALLFRQMREQQQLILTEQSYAAFLGFLLRRREYPALLGEWKAMLARYAADCQRWDAMELPRFLQDWTLDDEKQAELASLAVGVPCQALWLYHAALNAALTLGQTSNGRHILLQLCHWRRRWQQRPQQEAEQEAEQEQRAQQRHGLLSVVSCSHLLVEPRWTWWTFRLVLSLLARSAHWAHTVLTLSAMQEAGLLHPLHANTAVPVCLSAIAAARWDDLQLVIQHLQQQQAAVSLSLDALSSVAEELSRAADGQQPGHGAARERQRLLQYAVDAMRSQQLLSAVGTSPPLLDLSDLLTAAFTSSAASALSLVLDWLSLPRAAAATAALPLLIRCADEAQLETVQSLLAARFHLQAARQQPAGQQDAEGQQTAERPVLRVELQDSSAAANCPEPSPTSELSPSLPPSPSTAAPPSALLSSDRMVRSMSLLTAWRSAANWPRVQHWLAATSAEEPVGFRFVNGLAPLVRLCLRCWASRPPAAAADATHRKLHRLLFTQAAAEQQPLPSTAGSGSSSYPASLSSLHSALLDEAYAAASAAGLLLWRHCPFPLASVLIVHLPRRSSDLLVQCVLFLALHRLHCRTPLRTVEDAFIVVPELLVLCGNAALQQVANRALAALRLQPITPFTGSRLQREQQADGVTARSVFDCISASLPSAVLGSTRRHLLAVSRAELVEWMETEADSATERARWKEELRERRARPVQDDTSCAAKQDEAAGLYEPRHSDHTG